MNLSNQFNEALALPADERAHGEAMLMAEPNAWQQLEEEHLIAALSKFSGRRT